ncbi:MAG: RsmB/NOP family class I SAM-dependent RNA methyltransferase [Deltaproteobacteria bacterium]|nr:RsmB/NOP family class I SAM-dependent RNA methyltransferase [Deltaproteobacteria bacterium]
MASQPGSALKKSYSTWFIERLKELFGEEEAHFLCEVYGGERPITIRVNAVNGTREELRKKLQEKFRNIEFRASQFSPHALIASQPITLNEDPLYREGDYSLEDESHQLAPLALQPKQGEVIVDVAAGKGERATHLAELMRNVGAVHAWTQSPEEIEEIQSEVSRLGLGIVKTRLKDPTRMVRQKFDAALAYLPSSETGKIRRDPSIAEHLNPDRLQNLADWQLAVLHRIAPALKSGGRLVYAVSSLLPEEGEDLIFRFLKTFKMFGIEDLREILPPACYSFVNDQGFFKSLPEPGSMDGIFIARLSKAAAKETKG